MAAAPKRPASTTVREQLASLLRSAPNLRDISRQTGINTSTLSRIANSQRAASGHSVDVLAAHFKHELRPISRRSRRS